VPKNWLKLVNTPLTDAEIEACRLSARRGRPSGEEGPSFESMTLLAPELIRIDGADGERENYGAAIGDRRIGLAEER
jgi:hypothetical protein